MEEESKREKVILTESEKNWRKEAKTDMENK